MTILFADLVGSTSLGETLDPEELYELVDRVHKRVEESVLRYGGHVARHLGDGLMALFGAPTAHEDDAERAVLAGLAMQRALAELNAEQHGSTPPLGMRVGITSGEVVAGAMAGIYDVIGDAPNVAARLQGTAQIGGVLVGEETMRLARRRVRFGERQELTLKGKAEPVPAYAALGISEQVGERWEVGERAGYATPLVGREHELELILALWERARAGEGQLLTIIGEPGVGKSRLVAEGIERLIGEGVGSPRLLRGRCLSYGQSVSLWLIADLLRSLCSVPEDVGPEAVGERISATVGVVLAGCDETDRGIACDVLGEVLGLPPRGSLVAAAGPQIRRSSLIRSLGLVLGSLAESCPVALVLEDLHWLDTASAEILEALLTEVPGRRILVLATQRPGWTAPWSGWSWTERLTLRPLPDEDAAALAGAVLGGARLAPPLKDHLRERAEGNPFFVEELLRYLQETGGVEEREGEVRLLPGVAERLPVTLTEVLLARLDRLEAQVKGVAQVGSVIGRSFAVRLLSRVMEREAAALDGPLRALQQAEIAFPRGGGDPEYIFKHVTVREVAYGMVVQRRRRQLHLAVGRAIAQLYPADEYVEMIAYHLARTEEHEEAAAWLERAGDRAAEVYATETAIDSYQEARRRLERCRAAPGALARLDEKLGGTFYTAGRYDEALEALGRAVETHRADGDLEAAGRVTARMGRAHTRARTWEEGLALVQPMIELLAGTAPSQTLGSLYVALADLDHMASVFGVERHGEMQEAAERAGEIARSIGDERLLAEAELQRASSLWGVGRPGEALQIVERVMPLIEAGGDLDRLGRALDTAGCVCGTLFRMEEGRRYFERAAEVAKRVGNPVRTAWCLGNLGEMLTILGEWQEARTQLERAVRLLGDQRTRYAPWVPIRLGELALCQGRWEEAERIARDGVALAEVTGQPGSAAWWLLGEVETLTGRAEEAVRRLEGVPGSEDNWWLAHAYLEAGAVGHAEEQAARAIARARAGEPQFAPDWWWVHGMALTRQGRYEDAERTLREGLERSRSIPYPYGEGRFLQQLGLLAQERGEHEQARQHLEAAHDIFQRLGASKDVEQTEESLAVLPGA